jgi:hypothetical protein
MNLNKAVQNNLKVNFINYFKVVFTMFEYQQVAKSVKPDRKF